MNTRLVYVNKSKAQVKNEKDGSFFNNVDDGIVIKRGDEISIEQISIASKGVGSDIIEIPSNLQDYNYETNQQVLNFMIYINHNYSYTCKLPLSVQTATWALPTGQNNDDSFGYLNQTGFPITLPMTTNCKSKDFPRNSEDSGTRYYLGRYCPTSVTDYKKFYERQIATPTTLHQMVPGPLIFQFLETPVQIGADTGYDNPSNIANKITQDIHASTVFLNNTTIGQQGQNPDSFENVILPSLFQLTTSSFGSGCVSIDGQPQSQQHPTTDGFYTNIIGVKNPFKYYYGSRLMNGTITAKESSLLEASSTIPGPPNPPVLSNSIYFIPQPPKTTSGANIYTNFNNGFVYYTNIKYDGDNMVLLSKYIKSQKWFNRSVLPTNFTNTFFTPDDIDNNPLCRGAFVSNIDVGRIDDSQNTNPPTMVQNPFQQGTAKLAELQTKTFYDQEFYNKRFLDADSLSQTCFIDDTEVITINGQQYNAQTASQFLDVNLVAVNTGDLFGNNEIVIGIVMMAYSQPATSGNIAISQSEYGVFDPSYFRNDAVLVNNPDIVKAGSDTNAGDYTKFMNVGSPEAQLLFDPTRGRFAFTNLSWCNKLSSGTGTQADPGAGLNIITSNKKVPQTVYNSTNRTGIEFFTCYAQSGLGLRNISVIGKDNQIVEIDPYSPSDINEKFTNSLLNRLGFEYKALINLNGLPDVLFNNRNYDTVIPIANPNFFPYPLTTNLRFDTAISTSLGVSDNGLPFYNLSGQRGAENINLNANPDLAFASNLPSKLVFPFWLIKTDIIDCIGFNTANNGQNQNIMAVCNRAYISGDFTFSFATSYSFKATKEFSISGIKTSILNPDLSPADVDDGTTIIYKIVSPIPLFTQQNIIQESLDEKRIAEEKKEPHEKKVNKANEPEEDDDDKKQKIEK
jgi:hypothetical protein